MKELFLQRNYAHPTPIFALYEVCQESNNNVLRQKNTTTHENSISAAIFSQRTSIVLRNQSSFDGSTHFYRIREEGFSGRPPSFI